VNSFSIRVFLLNNSLHLINYLYAINLEEECCAMRKKFTIFLLIGFILSGTIDAKAAATRPKVGGACVRLNQSALVAGIELHCQKSGTKLVWAKRDKVHASAPTAASAPLPILSRQLSGDDAIYEPILVASYNQILGLPDVKSETKIQFIVDPNFPAAVAQGIEKAANVVISKFGYLIPKDVPIVEVLSTSSSFESEAFSSNPLLSPSLNQSNGVLSSRDSAYQNTRRNISALAFPIRENPGLALGVVYRNVAIQKLPTFDFYAVGAHETMHVVQFGSTRGAASNLPMWFKEGQATQIGDLNTFPNESISLVIAVTRAFPFPEGSNDLAPLEEVSGMDCCGLAYSRGLAATSYLTGKFGWAKVLQFTQSSSTQPDWQSAFREIFGESVTQFYGEVQPFIDWMGKVIRPGYDLFH
jgi:hypothetical protein